MHTAGLGRVPEELGSRAFPGSRALGPSYPPVQPDGRPPLFFPVRKTQFTADTREATLRCGEPMLLRRADATSIVGKDFLPAIALEEPVVGQGHGRFANGATME